MSSASSAHPTCRCLPSGRRLPAPALRPGPRTCTPRRVVPIPAECRGQMLAGLAELVHRRVTPSGVGTRVRPTSSSAASWCAARRPGCGPSCASASSSRSVRRDRPSPPSRHSSGAPSRSCCAAAAFPVDLVVAYEPVWAIGTGLTARGADAAAMADAIRSTLAALGAAGRRRGYPGALRRQCHERLDRRVPGRAGHRRCARGRGEPQGR